MWFYLYIRKNLRPIEFTDFSSVVYYIIERKKEDARRENASFFRRSTMLTKMGNAPNSGL